MASNPPPSGPGQPWPANPNDTPGTGYQTGGVPQQGQWPPPAQPAPSQWAQPAPSQWAQPPQGVPSQQPQQAQQPAPNQWAQPARPPQNQWGQQAQHGQWPPPPPAGQQPAQNQWAQQPQQGAQWPAPPPAAQPQQSQWAPQPQPGQWAQQPQGQWPPPPPPGNQWAPATAAAGWAGYDADATAMDYPVDVRFTPEGRIGRYWGIPILGFMLRYLLIIPHVILLVFVGLIAYLATWLTWIPVLLTGRYPGWGYTLVGGYLRWAIRVGTWLFLLSGTYPPFTGSPSDGQHVEVLFDEQRPVGRFWGIPVLGIAIRAILCIPHFIVLLLLAIVIYVLILFTWLPVLIYGRQADFMYSIVGGYVRWATRVYAYLLLLSGPYPPFRLS